MKKHLSVRERCGVNRFSPGLFQGAGAFAKRGTRRKHIVDNDVAGFGIDFVFGFLRNEEGVSNVQLAGGGAEVRLRSGVACAHKKIFDACMRNSSGEFFRKDTALVVSPFVFPSVKKRNGNERRFRQILGKNVRFGGDFGKIRQRGMKGMILYGVHQTHCDGIKNDEAAGTPEAEFSPATEDTFSLFVYDARSGSSAGGTGVFPDETERIPSPAGKKLIGRVARRSSEGKALAGEKQIEKRVGDKARERSDVWRFCFHCRKKNAEQQGVVQRFWNRNFVCGFF